MKSTREQVNNLRENAAKMQADGLSQKEIAERLNEKGILTPTGVKWTQPVVSYLLLGKYGKRVRRKAKRSIRAKAAEPKSDKLELAELILASEIDPSRKTSMLRGLFNE